MEFFKEHLTTEDLHKKFKNQFDLVNYAIRLAENMLKTGRDPRVKVEAQNRAIHVLEEIASGTDVFDEIQEPVTEETIVASIHPSHQEENRPPREKRKHNRNSSNILMDEGSSPKRNRKILVE